MIISHLGINAVESWKWYLYYGSKNLQSIQIVLLLSITWFSVLALIKFNIQGRHTGKHKFCLTELTVKVLSIYVDLIVLM